MVGLIAAFVTGCICFLLPFPSWQSLVGLITSASVLMYAGAPLSLGAFRRPVPDAERPFRLPAAGWWRRSSFVVANLIILVVRLDTVWKLGVVLILLGYAILVADLYGASTSTSTGPPRLAGRLTWLPVWLIGLGIISWPGQYSGSSDTRPQPPTNTFSIPFWWDILIVAAFSLIIYYWAMRAKLPREEMLALVSLARRRAGTTGCLHPPLSPVRACSRAAWRCSRSA